MVLLSSTLAVCIEAALRIFTTDAPWTAHTAASDASVSCEKKIQLNWSNCHKIIESKGNTQIA